MRHTYLKQQIFTEICGALWLLRPPSGGGGAITPVQACPFLILTTAKYPLQADTKPTPRAHITLAEEQMQLGKTKKSLSLPASRY